VKELRERTDLLHALRVGKATVKQQAMAADLLADVLVNKRGSLGRPPKVTEKIATDIYFFVNHEPHEKRTAAIAEAAKNNRLAVSTVNVTLKKMDAFFADTLWARQQKFVSGKSG
jgi:hypothetical protein